MKNKTSLIRFLANEFKKEKYKEILQCHRKVIFITSEKKCWKITGESVEEVPELASSQEEARYLETMSSTTSYNSKSCRHGIETAASGRARRTSGCDSVKVHLQAREKQKP